MVFKFGIWWPSLFIREYHNFHSNMLLIKNMAIIFRVVMSSAGSYAKKYAPSIMMNPKAPKGPHNRPKTGIIAISKFNSEDASPSSKSNIVIKVMHMENNKINFLDLKSVLILFITFTTVVFYCQHCNVINGVIIIVNMI